MKKDLESNEKKTSARKAVSGKAKAKSTRRTSARRVSKAEPAPVAAEAAVTDAETVSKPSVAPQVSEPIAAAGVDGDAVLARMKQLEETLLQELRAVRQAVLQPVPTQESPELEAEVDALRRLLGELLERRTEGLAARLAGLRTEVASTSRLEKTRLLEQLDELIADLGGMPFEVPRLDFPDPLICEVTEQRRVADAPEGVVVETVRPGFRTARGRVLIKAAVAVNALGA